MDSKFDREFGRLEAHAGSLERDVPVRATE